MKRFADPATLRLVILLILCCWLPASAAEPSAAEPSAAEPSAAEPSAAEPSAAEPSADVPLVDEKLKQTRYVLRTATQSESASAASILGDLATRVALQILRGFARH